MESIDHLFIHCHVASFIWRYFLTACGVSCCFSGSAAMLFEAWRHSYQFRTVAAEKADIFHFCWVAKTKCNT